MQRDLTGQRRWESGGSPAGGQSGGWARLRGRGPHAETARPTRIGNKSGNRVVSGDRSGRARGDKTTVSLKNEAHESKANMDAGKVRAVRGENGIPVPCLAQAPGIWTGTNTPRHRFAQQRHWSRALSSQGAGQRVAGATARPEQSSFPRQKLSCEVSKQRAPRAITMCYLEQRQ